MSGERILIVDDDPGTLDLLSTYIESFGYYHETAEDGAKAVTKLQEGNFTILITDMIMPHLDGMQLLKYTRDYYPNLGVIVITGGTTYSYTDVIKAGASDFISKPFNVDELEAKLNRLVRELNLIEKLQQYSTRDALTDLYNRRYFDINILTEVQRADRQGYKVFMLMADVDNLKEYNDKFGHQGGDELLRAVSSIILQSVRENVDWSFRYGGDEFGIIFIQLELTQVVKVGERILGKYQQANFTGTGLSLGVARFLRHADVTWQEDIDNLVARADKALYGAKSFGKNQAFIDEESKQ